MVGAGWCEGPGFGYERDVTVRRLVWRPVEKRCDVTRIIIDSTCDVPEDLRERFGILVLPLSVVIDGRTYRDGVEIRLDDVYGAMREGKVPGTAQIRADDARELFSSVCEAGDDLIYLSFSAEMSGTFDLASLVRDELRETYPSRRMEVVDSRGGSIGTGLIALQLGLMNEQGVSFDTLLSRCLWMTQHVKYAFTIDDLKWALQGGRLTVRTVASIGGLLKIKPVLDVKGGKLHLSKIVHGTKQSLGAVVDMAVRSLGSFDNQIIGVAYADDRKKAEEVKRLLREAVPACTVLCQRIGAVLGTHLGIGGVGVFCMDQRPDFYCPL